PLLPDRLARTLAGAGVGTGTLATQRQATTVTQAAVATQVHQALDCDADFTTQIAFDNVLADFQTQAFDFRLRQIADLGGRSNACDFADLLRTGTADAVNALQPDPDVLLGWQVDACNTRHDAVLQLSDGRIRTNGAPIRQDGSKNKRAILSRSRFTLKPVEPGGSIDPAWGVCPCSGAGCR